MTLDAAFTILAYSLVLGFSVLAAWFFVGLGEVVSGVQRAMAAVCPPRHFFRQPVSVRHALEAGGMKLAGPSGGGAAANGALSVAPEIAIAAGAAPSTIIKVLPSRISEDQQWDCVARVLGEGQAGVQAVHSNQSAAHEQLEAVEYALTRLRKELATVMQYHPASLAETATGNDASGLESDETSQMAGRLRAAGAAMRAMEEAKSGGPDELETSDKPGRDEASIAA